MVFSVFNYGYLTRDFAPDVLRRAGFLSVPCISQETTESALETLGSTGLFEGVGSSSSSRNDPNPTVRIPISRICNLTQHGLKLPSGLRRQFQVDVSFFCFFLYDDGPADAQGAFAG